MPTMKPEDVVNLWFWALVEVLRILGRASRFIVNMICRLGLVVLEVTRKGDTGHAE